MRRPVSARRFPILGLLAVWTCAATFLILLFRNKILGGLYNDPDDYLRLLQVRDLLAGQSWFDLTQHRINPPGGLPMHWSRLVDIPLAATMALTKPILGPIWAERIAATIVPMATLFLLILASLVQIRRLFGANRELQVMAPLLLLSAPLLIVQFYPTRIDHHGWQITTAALALAALLGRNPWRSGLLSGFALGCYLAISIEGAPFVIAMGGATGLLWALGIDRTDRFAWFLSALATTSVSAFMVATPADWQTPWCDAVAPGHLAALSIAALGSLVITHIGKNKAVPVRLAMLLLPLIAGGTAMALIAPQCLANPYGQMDPVVADLWFQNVSEGLPFWKQDAVGITGMLAFPILGTIGAYFAARQQIGNEAQRRWWLVLIVSTVATLTGAMVLRAAGVASVAALPGAFAIMIALREWLIRRVRPQLADLAGALSLVGMAPIMPVMIVGALFNEKAETKAPPQTGKPIKAAPICDRDCGYARLAKLPPMAIFGSIDVGPRVLISTPHHVFAGGYHRLQKPLRTTIDIFKASPREAEALVRKTGYRFILIDPNSSEAGAFRRIAPTGFMAQLSDNKTPPWLQRIDLGTDELRLYRLRD